VLTTPIAPGVRRLTLPLPVRPGHVHMYLLRAEDGWTLVDTGLALPGLADLLEGAQREVEGRIVRIVVTHMHPDHVGGAAVAAEATGAPVYQSALDYEQCVGVWGNAEWPQRIADWFLGHGVPASVAEELIEQGSVYAPFIRIARDPRPLAEGDEIGGWRALETPGHADGHVCLLRDGVLVSADHVLDPISPAVGLWPEARPDPLGDYLASLERTAELAPRLVLPGHGEPIRDPAGRARALLEHHRLRLDATAAALDGAALTGYDVSFGLFGADLGPSARRFAVAETLSHLERLRREGRAERAEEDGVVRWAAPV
jgi:glyoxylase-like metal-dependent hydrolase (beta-lactamase superfamily II)